MDMQIEAIKIRDARRSRAWSQEHMASLAGLGLRTVQRIESNGSASYESIGAIASVLEIPLSELLVTQSPERPTVLNRLGGYRLILLLCVCFLAMMFSPPSMTISMTVAMGVWLLFEFFMFINERGSPTD